MPRCPGGAGAERGLPELRLGYSAPSSAQLADEETARHDTYPCLGKQFGLPKDKRPWACSVHSILVENNPPLPTHPSHPLPTLLSFSPNLCAAFALSHVRILVDPRAVAHSTLIHYLNAYK